MEVTLFHKNNGRIKSIKIPFKTHDIMPFSTVKYMIKAAFTV